MNNKELATGVLKHPLIQEILKQKLAESSVVNRLIVEEIMMEDELEEAANPKGNLAAKVRNYISRALDTNKTPEEIIKLISRESKQYKEWAFKATKVLGKEEGPKELDRIINKEIEKRLSSEKTTVRSTDASPEQMAKFQSTIEKTPESYGRILNNAEEGKAFTLSDEQKEILKQTFDKAQSSPKEQPQDTNTNLEVISDYLGWAAAASSLGGVATSPLTSALSVSSDSTAILDIYNLAADGKEKEALVKLTALVGGKVAASMVPGGEAFKQLGGEAADQITKRFGKKVSEEVVTKALRGIAKGTAGLAGKKAAELIAKRAVEKQEEASEELKKAGITDQIKNAFGEMVDTVTDYFSGGKAEKGSQEVLKNQKYQPLFDLAAEDITKRALAYFIYFIEQPFGDGRLDEYRLKGTNIPEEQYKAGRKWVRSKLGMKGIEALIRFVSDKQAQALFQQIFAKQELALIKPALDLNTDNTDDSENIDQDQDDDQNKEQDLKKKTDDAIENVQVDFDKSQVEKIKVDKGILDTMDIFFGQNEEEGNYSFLHRAFLSDQADMLWTLVSDLNKIINPQGDQELAINEGMLDRIKNTFSNEEKETEIELDKKERLSLKRELSAFADLLREVKRLAEAYKQFATQSGSDPSYDGSRLKQALMGSGEGSFGLLGEVQKHCAILAKEIARIKQEQLSSLDEAKETDDEKRVRRQTVIDTFNQMGTMYLNSLRPALKGELDDKVDTADINQSKAQETAQQMLDMIREDPNIVKYFPKALVSNTTGKVVTLKQATIALDAEIKAFGKVLRDIYRLAKGESMAGSDVSRMGAVLISLAETLESSFNIPSMISDKVKKEIEKDTPPDLQPLGEEPKEQAEQSSTFPEVAEIAKRYAQSDEDKEESEESMIDSIMKKVREEVPKEDIPETEEALEVVVQQEIEKYVSPIFKSDDWQSLEDKQKEAIREFIKLYNQSITLEEILDPKDPKSTYSRRQTKQQKILDGFHKRINLHGPGGKKKLSKIYKNMEPKNRNEFIRLVKIKDPVIDFVVKHLTKPDIDDEEFSSRAGQRLRSKVNTFKRREEQLIKKLEPIIEKIIKEQ